MDASGWCVCGEKLKDEGALTEGEYELSSSSGFIGGIERFDTEFVDGGVASGFDGCGDAEEAEFLTIHRQMERNDHVHVGCRAARLAGIVACLFDEEEQVGISRPLCACADLSDEVRAPLLEVSDPRGESVRMQRYSLGFVFTEVGESDAHHNLTRFQWGLGPADEEPLIIGFDVVATDDDGRIERVAGFLDRFPPDHRLSGARRVVGRAPLSRSGASARDHAAALRA
ncbi:MAG: hypothetical protein K0Q52_377 [Microbacterium sp.]|nr:hypothetical protein [Microbacterium sp.]